MLYKDMRDHSKNFEPIILSRKDFAFVKTFEKNWLQNHPKPEKLDNTEDVNKVISSIIKREVINCLYSLFQKTVQVPVGTELVNTSINDLKFNLNISFESLGKQDTVWFLKTIQSSLETNRLIPLPEFLALATFGIKNEPTLYKVLYERFKNLSPKKFLFNEHNFSTSEKNIRNRVQNNRDYSNNTYATIINYWNSVNKPETIHLSTFIIYLISNYYISFAELLNNSQSKENIPYDRSKFAFAIKQLLSDSSSSIDERKEKVDCVRNALEIAGEIKAEYDNIYSILSSNKKATITQSQRIFYEYCSEHIAVINETSALAALIKV